MSAPVIWSTTFWVTFFGKSAGAHAVVAEIAVDVAPAADRLEPREEIGREVRRRRAGGLAAGHGGARRIHLRRNDRKALKLGAPTCRRRRMSDRRVRRAKPHLDLSGPPGRRTRLEKNPEDRRNRQRSVDARLIDTPCPLINVHRPTRCRTSRPRLHAPAASRSRAARRSTARRWTAGGADSFTCCQTRGRDLLRDVDARNRAPACVRRVGNDLDAPRLVV